MAFQVVSNQSDYAPFSTAVFTANGFGAGDDISFVVTIIDPLDGTVSTLNAGAPDAYTWTVIDGASGDLDGATDGSVTTTWFVDPYYANTTLLVTATDLDTGATASEVFTDSNPGGTGKTENSPLQIAKSVVSVGGVAGDGAATYAGEQIVYQVTVTNTGSTALSGVQVTDTLGGTLGTIASLAAGATATYSYTYAVKQSDIDHDGSVALTPGTQVFVSLDAESAYESVSFTGGGAPWQGGISTNVVTGQQVLTINPGSSYNAALATNTYAWCVDVAHGLVLGGQSLVYTLNALGVTNATQIAEVAAWGDQQLSSNPSNPNLLAAAVQSEIWELEYPGLTVTASKTPGGVTDTTNLINEIAYINNTVLPTLSPVGGGAQANWTSGGTVGTTQTLYLAPGIYNTATATAGGTTSTSTVDTPVLQSPAISIVKSVTSVGGVAGDPAATHAGEVIDYSIVVTNTGNETLSNVVVTDPTLGTTLGTLASLAPGASQTYLTSQAVTQAEIDSGNVVTNTATVTDTQTPSQSSSVSTGVTDTPNVSIVKSVISVGGAAGDPAATAAGQVIDYSIVVTNTGNETLTNVVVTDPTLGTTLGTLASLAPGASQTYLTSQAVTQAEIDSGNVVTNTATVTDTQTPSQSSTVSTGVTDTPNVSIVKSVTSVNGVAGDPAATAAGQVIDYSVVVTNTGNETLTNVVVTDPTLGTTLGTLATLAPGASQTYLTSQAVTQAEIDSGNAVPNTATVSDDETPSQSSTVSTGVTDTPNVSIVKSVTSVNGVAGDPAATAAGQVIDYSVVVTNTGNETLTNVVVTDPTLGTTLGTLATLAPGASQTYLTSQAVTQQAEIDSAKLRCRIPPP